MFNFISGSVLAKDHAQVSTLNMTNEAGTSNCKFYYVKTLFYSNDLKLLIRSTPVLNFKCVIKSLILK